MPMSDVRIAFFVLAAFSTFRKHIGRILNNLKPIGVFYG